MLSLLLFLNLYYFGSLNKQFLSQVYTGKDVCVCVLIKRYVQECTYEYRLETAQIVPKSRVDRYIVWDNDLKEYYTAMEKSTNGCTET